MYTKYFFETLNFNEKQFLIYFTYILIFSQIQEETSSAM